MRTDDDIYPGIIHPLNNLYVGCAFFFLEGGESGGVDGS